MLHTNWWKIPLKLQVTLLLVSQSRRFSFRPYLLIQWGLILAEEQRAAYSLCRRSSMQRKLANKPQHTAYKEQAINKLCCYVVVSYQHHTDQHIHKDIASHYQIDIYDIRVQRIVEESNTTRNNLRPLIYNYL